jgi:DNA invertase Pin-like site-specific DNA recombinase
MTFVIADPDLSLGADFRSLRNNGADTTTPRDRLRVLDGLAEFERELIHSRASEGRQRAKAKGMVFRPKPKQMHHQRQEAAATPARHWSASPAAIASVI